MIRLPLGPGFRNRHDERELACICGHLGEVGRNGVGDRHDEMSHADVDGTARQITAGQIMG